MPARPTQYLFKTEPPVSVAVRQFAEAGDACHSGHVVADPVSTSQSVPAGGLQKSGEPIQLSLN